MAKRRQTRWGPTEWVSYSGPVFIRHGDGRYTYVASVAEGGKRADQHLLKRGEGWYLGEEYMGRTIQAAVDNAGKRIANWSLIGREYAEESAREAFAPYKGGG